MIRRSIAILASLLFPALFFCATQESKGDSQAKRLFNQINGEPVVPRSAVTISIKEFTDATSKFNHTKKLTLKIRDYITSDGRLSVTLSNGDLELTGKISTFQIQPIAYSPQGIPVKKRLLIVSTITLIDFKKNKIIFQNQPIQAFHEYSEQIPPVTMEIQALDLTIQKLSERIQVQTINGWYTSLMSPVEKGKR